MSKDKAPVDDPHMAREAAKYDNPIPSREYIIEVLEQAAGPMTHEELCDYLKMSSEDDIEALRRRLIAMSRDGQLLSNRRQGYGVIDKMDLVRGRVQGHKDGFGFLVPADGGDDLFLSYRQMRKVFDGDEVLARKTGTDFKGRPEGGIVEVLVHNTNQIVGRFFSDNGVQFVRPDNARLSHDVMIAADGCGKAKANQFVVVEITAQPGRNNPPAGRILEVLGDHMAPGMEIDVAIRAHGIPNLWPSDVTAEAKRLRSYVEENDKDYRLDMRDMPFVTIDGEDARDFDDAVFCEPIKSGGWRLYVAIADVSHYVPVGSALDREALVRSTSVYFPDHVVPMLPEAISNGLCSLNPHVDRLSMVCEMTISTDGQIEDYQFYEAVIYSHARLTYNQVGAVLDQQSAGFGRKLLSKLGLGKKAKLEMSEDLAAVIDDVKELHNLYGALRKARDVRGAIDFETTETRIVFDENRKIEKIVPTVRNDAHKLIEECMLAANVSAAKFLEKHELPALYRVHPCPKDAKLDNLRTFLGEMGLSLSGGDKPQTGDYQKLLQSIKKRPDARLIQTVMLRSLSQAKYQPDNDGHFGLGYDAYAHFTSPIRRYPDLLVHRAIRHVVRSNVKSKHVVRVDGARDMPKKQIFPYSVADMSSMGEQSSQNERRADEATREVVSWLKCEYLRDHVGDEFDGTITAATGFGLFVELKDLYVEGLIHITNLPKDYYHFEAAHHRLMGERSGQVFRLGDELRVRVAKVELDDRKVDFELVEIKNKVKGKAKPAADKAKPKGRERDDRGGKGRSGGRDKRSAGGRGRSDDSRGDRKPAGRGGRGDSGGGRGHSDNARGGRNSAGRNASTGRNAAGRGRTESRGESRQDAPRNEGAAKKPNRSRNRNRSRSRKPKSDS